MVEKNEIKSVFYDELEWIKDTGLRDKVVEVWFEAANRGKWKSLDDVPFTLLFENSGKLTDHTKRVVKLAKTILDVRDDSGIIFRCPECNRKLRDGICEEHGEVEGKADLRIRALLDDGTGAVEVIFNREISEKLLGKGMEDYMEVAEEAMDYSIVHEDIIDKIVTKPVRVKGDSLSSDFIVTIFARDAQIIKIDKEKEMEELMMQLEGLQ